jgi:hypothetical protein
MSRTAFAVLLALAGLPPCPPGARAAPLYPGETLAPVPPLAPPPGDLAGHVDAAFQSTSGPPLSGTVSEDVIRKPDDTLAFVYRLSTTSATPLTAAGLTNYAGFFTDVGSSGSGVAPDSVKRSGGPGSGVTFTFAPGVGLGESSTLLVIDTDATAFGAGNASLAGPGGASAGAAALGPAPAPEPGTLALVLAGLPLLAAAGYRRWRRQVG